MTDCLFCRIVKHEISAEIVYEDEGTAAFLDINPKAPGHTVVIPKNHRETVADLEVKEVSEVFGTVQKMARRVARAMKADGLNIGINEKPAGGQVVEHLHIHILPRFRGDRGTSVHGIVNNPPCKSLQEIGKLIRNEK